MERELSAAIKTDHRELNRTSHHLLHAGGKRIRPVFVLLAGKFGDYAVDKLKYIAVPLELIHMATLVHDDVIDNAETRRGKKTVKSQWDNRVAMFTGDFIFARALKTASHLPDPKLHQILADAIVEICVGEIEQIRDFFNWQQSTRQYLRRIRRKTALLIAISCQLGAMVSDAEPENIRALYTYGYNVGMAFQITDDILDFTGTAKELGKPAGSDLRQGNVTLPVLHVLAHGDESQKAQILSYLQSGGQAHPIEDMVQIINDSAGIPFAEQLAQSYLNKGIAALDRLPSSRSQESLREIAFFIGKRSF